METECASCEARTGLHVLLQVASISQLTVSRLSRQCGILNISQPYRPPRSVTGIPLHFLVVSIAYNVSFIICLALCAVFCLSVMCYFLWYVYFCVLYLIVVPLPPGKIAFVVQLNNNRNNNNFTLKIEALCQVSSYLRLWRPRMWHCRKLLHCLNLAVPGIFT
jgi:hypothetical protein